jgi:flagellar basal body rod protein FlgC
MRVSIDQLTARLQQQSIQLAQSSAAATAAESATAAAHAERRESLSKLAAVAADLEKCKAELDSKKSQATAQQQKLAAAQSSADKQSQALRRSEAAVAELETRVKEAAAATALLQRDLVSADANNAALSLELHAAKATISQLTKSKADACVGYDAVPPEDDGAGYVSLKDMIAESQLLVCMADKGAAVMRHRSQLLLDRFYEGEALRLHRILTSAKKRHVTFKSQLDVGEFCINDAPDSVALARKTVSDSQLDAADKLLQKRRKKCEGQIKWQHAEAQAMCLASHSMCLSPQPDASVVPAILACKGKVISSSDLQQWISAASSCTKFDLHAPIKSPQLAPLRDRSHSLSADHAAAAAGLQSIDAALGGLSPASLCHLFFALRGCSTLRSLNFSFNGFSEMAAAALGSLLATACVAELRLSSCDIASSYTARMHLGAPWLTDLDLSNNDIRDEGFVALALSLQAEACSLRKLNCANNSLGPASCKTLSAALELNSSLHALVLDDNVSLRARAAVVDLLPRSFPSPFRFWKRVYLM